MQITGVTLEDFSDIVAKVSAERYAGNVIVHPDSRDCNGKRAPRIQARLRTNTSIGSDKDSLAPGAKWGFSGRRIPAACWHVYRDVLTELFARNPNAVVRTAMAKYDGQNGFEENYRETGYKNVGSMMCPQYASEVCDCAY